MKKLLLLIFSVAVMSCGGEKESKETKEKAAPAEAKWQMLFDGSSTDGWRGYNEETLPEGWIIEDGMLKALGKGGDIGGDIIYGAEAFENFELSLEWKIAEGGNSGLFYHVLEGEQYHAAYENAPEYQLIDDIGYPGNLAPWQSVGADYAMYDPPADKVIRGHNEWNQTRIIFTAKKVEYWLNGVKTVEFVPWSDDWNTRKAEGKWKDFPDYGMAKSGFIGLQDHGGVTWFRDIKIKKL